MALSCDDAEAAKLGRLRDASRELGASSRALPGEDPRLPRVGPFLARCFGGSAFPASVPDLAGEGTEGRSVAVLCFWFAFSVLCRSFLRRGALCQAPKPCFIVATGFRLNQKSCTGQGFRKTLPEAWSLRSRHACACFERFLSTTAQEKARAVSEAQALWELKVPETTLYTPINGTS